jgi:hypothetical protein
MRISDERTLLDLTLAETIPEGIPGAGDLRLDVQVHAAQFTGRNETVWVSKAQFERFLLDLFCLMESRSGIAELASMSPEKFHLGVRVRDSAGHIELRGELGKVHWGGDARRSLKNQIAFAMDYDPTRLANLLEDFRTLRALP